MATRARRTNEEWLAIIQECRSSGLTDSQWCLRNGISPSSLYSRIKWFKRKGVILPESTGVSTSAVIQEVVPVGVNPYYDDTANKSDDSPIETLNAPALSLQVNGIRLEINNHAHCDLVDSAIRALRSLC